MAKLIDGAEYWLGATWGTYSAEYDVFLLGNCFVPRHHDAEWYGSPRK